MYPLNSSPCFFGSGYTRKEDLLSQIRQQLDPFNQVNVEPQNLLDHEALFEQEMVARQAAHDAKMARLRQEFIYSKSLKNTIQESKQSISLVSCGSMEIRSLSPVLVSVSKKQKREQGQLDERLLQKKSLLTQDQKNFFDQVSLEQHKMSDQEALFEKEMVARQLAHAAKMARLRQEFIYSNSSKKNIQESKHTLSLVSCDSVELTSVSPILVLAPHPKERSSFGTQIGGQIHSLSPAISIQSLDAVPGSLSIEPPILRNKPCYIRPLSPESLSISSFANSASKPFIAPR